MALQKSARILFLRRYENQQDGGLITIKNISSNSISNPSSTPSIKTALVHDWLHTYAGAEKCLESFASIWLESEIFTLFDCMDISNRKKIIGHREPRTSFLQTLPGIKNYYRYYLPLYPLAIEQFDLHDYDLILSSSHAVAKNILTHAEQLHISYVHTPMRYAWDLYYHYLKDHHFQHGFKRHFIQYILHKIRIWDSMSANRVDVYIANSRYVARRIQKVYGKKATVIYPPVDVEKFSFKRRKEDYYLTASRLVPYKRVDLIIEAFKILGKKLIVIGDGPELNRIKNLAGKSTNIEILGYQDDTVLIDLMEQAKAFVFAAEEDFGITPVEAQAAGTPVICYGRGGAMETVRKDQTGIYFFQQSPHSLIEAIERFEKFSDFFDPGSIHRHALTFSRARFESEIRGFVRNKYQQFQEKKRTIDRL